MNVTKEQENVIIKSMNKNHNKIIAMIETEELPLNVLSEEVNVKGKAIIVSAKIDNKEEIEELLIELGLINEFDEKMKEKIINLGMALLSHSDN